MLLKVRQKNKGAQGYRRQSTSGGALGRHEHTSEGRLKVGGDSLWLWGRLRDFERYVLLDKAQEELLETMNDRMRGDMHRLAP